LLVFFTENHVQNFLGGGKVQVSRSLEVLGSLTRLPNSLEKIRIPEGRRVLLFWSSEGILGVEHFGISKARRV